MPIGRWHYSPHRMTSILLHFCQSHFWLFRLFLQCTVLIHTFFGRPLSRRICGVRVTDYCLLILLPDFITVCPIQYHFWHTVVRFIRLYPLQPYWFQSARLVVSSLFCSLSGRQTGPIPEHKAGHYKARYRARSTSSQRVWTSSCQWWCGFVRTYRWQYETAATVSPRGSACFLHSSYCYIRVLQLAITDLDLL